MIDRKMGNRKMDGEIFPPAAKEPLLDINKTVDERGAVLPSTRCDESQTHAFYGENISANRSFFGYAWPRCWTNASAAGTPVSRPRIAS